MKTITRLSIVKQLTLIAGLGLIGMVLMLIIQQWSNQHIRSLNESRLLLSEIKSEMLTLRRNEKDFMARKNKKYLDKFNNNHQILINKNNQLQSLMQEEQISTSTDVQLSQVFMSYGETFNKVAALIEKIGLDPKSGLYGSLRKAVHQAEELLNNHNQIKLSKDMLMLRRREKDFMLAQLTLAEKKKVCLLKMVYQAGCCASVFLHQHVLFLYRNRSQK